MASKRRWHDILIEASTSCFWLTGWPPTFWIRRVYEAERQPQDTDNSFFSGRTGPSRNRVTMNVRARRGTGLGQGAHHATEPPETRRARTGM